MFRKFLNLYQFDWTVISQGDKVLAINKHTGNQFQLQKIDSNSQHLLEIYMARTQYTIPNTPQILLGSSKSSDQSIEMFVQRAPFSVEKLFAKNNSKEQIGWIFKLILKTIQFLVNKYGFFRITFKMIRVTRSFNYLVWINQNFSANHRQFPIGSANINQDYKQMISDLLLVFLNSNSKYKSMFQQLRDKIKLQKLLSFQKIKSLLQKQLKNDITNYSSKKKHYKSPQFLKRKKISQFQYLHPNMIDNQTDRKKTSGTTGETTSQISNFKQNSCQLSIESKQAHKKNRFFLKNNKLIKSTQSQYLNIKKPKHSGSTIFHNQRKHLKKIQSHLSHSKSRQKFTNQCNIKNNSLSKKIRNSGDSLATTAAACIKSTESQTMSQYFLIENGKERQNLKRRSSDSARLNSLKIQKQKRDQFKIKASRIILQHNNQQPTTPKIEQKQATKQQKNAQFCQYQKQFRNLLNSTHEAQINYTQRSSNTLNELQNDLNKVLYF